MLYYKPCLWYNLPFPTALFMRNQRIQFDVFVGPAGAGKDTITKQLVREVPHSTRMSTGDICRGAKSGIGRYSYYQDEMNAEVERMDNGGLVSDEVAFSLTKQAVMKALVFGTNHFFLTGFPRNLAQLDMFDQWRTELQKITGSEVGSRFICLDLDPKLSDERRRTRIEEALAKGHEPRKDDREDVFLKRAAEYTEHTLPLVEALTREGRIKNVHVNGSIEANYCKVREALGLMQPSHPERR